MHGCGEDQGGDDRGVGVAPAPRRQYANPVIGLIDEVVRMNGRLKSIFGRAHEGTGLSSMEAAVLTSIVEGAAPPTVPQIGRSMGHARQVIQRAANALIDMTLVEAVPNPDHKRAQLLRPTARGERVKADIDARSEGIADLLLADIDAARCARIADDLRSVRAILEARVKQDLPK